MDADAVKSLSPAQCILLTVHFASEANIRALHSFTPTRHDALDPELVLRILLTYLPEAVEPREYLSYICEVASRLYLDVDREDVEVNTAPVKDLSDADAQKKVKKLRLLNIQAPSSPPHAPEDLVTRFVCHRAYRIDQETGLLHLVPALIEPFLDRNDFIRVWYIGMCLPLIRLITEYYPDDESLVTSLYDFEKIRGREAVELLLKKSGQQPTKGRSNIARDIKCLVGPWMYGQTNQKRRKLNWGQNEKNRAQQDRENAVEDATKSMRRISLDGMQPEDRSTGHDWEHVFSWLLSKASSDLGFVACAIEDWEGPRQIDLGGIQRDGLNYLDEDVEKSLERQYAQAAFACCYVAQADTNETITDAHSILASLAELLDFIPPPDLATSVDSLPKIERHAVKLDDSQKASDLLPEALLRHDHPLTTPRLETYMLLQMMVYSAYQFSGLSYPLSLVNVARLHFYATAEEQRDILRKILHGLTKPGARKDDSQWNAERSKVIWLWNWGIEADKSDPDHGAGVLGKISKADFEEEMLKVFTETSCKWLQTS